MAEDLNFKGNLDAQSVIQGLEEVDDAIAKTKASAAGLKDGIKKTRESNRKKDWKGLLDIFGTILPRGLQRSIRQFQGTSRAVRRASTSFKVLGLSIAALGIPLLIQGLSFIIDNWEKISDFFSGTTEGMKTQAEVTDAAVKSLTEYNTANEYLLRIVNTSTLSLERRLQAQEALSQSSRTIAGLDITNADDLERLNAATQRARDLEVNRAQQQVLSNKIAEKRNEALNGEITATQKFFAANWVGTGIMIENAALRNNATADANAYQLQLDNLIGAQNDLNAAEQAELDIQKEQAEARKAEEDAAAQTAATIKYRADLQEKLNDKEVLYGLEGQEREDALFLQRLAVQLKTEKAKGASWAQLKQIEEQGLKDLAAIQKQYADDEAERAEIQRVSDEEDANAEYIRKQDDAHDIEQFLLEKSLTGLELAKEKEADALVRGYEKRFEIVEAGSQAELDLQEQQRLDVAALNEKYDTLAVNEALKADKAVLASRKQMVDTTMSAIGTLVNAGEKNIGMQKAFAVTEILLNQGRAFATALAGASAAAAGAGPAAPFVLGGYIASMFAALASSFAQIKQIMAKADSPTPDVNVTPSSVSTVQNALIPTSGNFSERGMAGMSAQAYVVQSQLEGQERLSNRISDQTTL